jgi:hypothetical protein
MDMAINLERRKIEASRGFRQLPRLIVQSLAAQGIKPRVALPRYCRVVKIPDRFFRSAANDLSGGMT